jgi:DeoR/GlpR family transcriptional regulator of sugar metabolism
VIRLRTDQRRTAILELLERTSTVQVEELARQFAVSLVTIRKDLTDLEQRGLLRRTHGGATPAHKALFNPSFIEKLHVRDAQKDGIAQAALEFIENGDTLILDAGSSTLQLARKLRARFQSLFVMTNSMPIALELSDSPFEVLVLGGQMRHHSMALIGPASAVVLGAYHADKAFIGATGVSLAQGYTTPNPFEAQTKTAMVRASDRVFALVDSSKLGRATLASFAPLDDIEVLITDAQAPQDFLQGLETRGLAFVLAESESRV